MKIIEHNALTGETTEREATAEEIAQAEVDLASFQEFEVQKAAKEAAKAAVLEKLGLTAEELAALL